MIKNGVLAKDIDYPITIIERVRTFLVSLRASLGAKNKAFWRKIGYNC